MNEMVFRDADGNVIATRPAPPGPTDQQKAAAEKRARKLAEHVRRVRVGLERPRIGVLDERGRMQHFELRTQQFELRQRRATHAPIEQPCRTRGTSRQPHSGHQPTRTRPTRGSPSQSDDPSDESDLPHVEGFSLIGDLVADELHRLTEGRES